jgi:protein arginine N-methyltransferase 1
LKDYLIINKDEEITGTFSLAPNAKNERDLDLVIHYEFNGESGSYTDTLNFKMC